MSPLGKSIILRIGNIALPKRYSSYLWQERQGGIGLNLAKDVLLPSSEKNNEYVNLFSC